MIMAIADHVKIEHAWSGMSCHVCSRGQFQDSSLPLNKCRVDACDLGIHGARDDGYCCLFVAYEDRVKSKREMRRMMEMHVQRWIRERIAPGE